MLLAVVVLLVGIGLLAGAADQFVIGAARLALIRNVPALLVGVVIVGFGTSAPELLVSALAAAGGEPEIAIGNIVGSNIANLALLLGIGALLVPLATTSGTVRREAPITVGAMVLFGVVVQGGINRLEGAVLLVAMALVLFAVTRYSPGDPIGPDVVELTDPSHHRLGTEVLRTVLGLAGTIVAAQLLLWGAVDLADRAGLGSGFVGASLVAIGTSLPELVTVIQSARRAETDLIVGNLLGSNLFNALTVGGVTGLIGSSALDAPKLTSYGVGATIVVATAAALAMATDHRVSRREGVAMILAYLAAMALLA